MEGGRCMCGGMGGGDGGVVLRFSRTTCTTSTHLTGLCWNQHALLNIHVLFDPKTQKLVSA